MTGYRIGIFESVCGGYGIGGEELPENFLREGFTMLRAVCESLRGSTSIAAVPILHRKIQNQDIPKGSILLDGATDEEVVAQIVQAVAQNNLDAITVIAPEIDWQLAELTSGLLRAGVTLWNCGSSFARLAADKFAFARFCSDEGIPHPRTRVLSELIRDWHWMEFGGRVVVKPRYGAGCIELAVFEDWREARRFTESNKTFARRQYWILQDWVLGRACSRSIVSDGQSYEMMPLVTQEFAAGKLEHSESATTLSYQGANMLEDCNVKTGVEIIEQVLSKFPGEHTGWIGFDLVVSDNQECCLIEVNARFTTSFAFLQQTANRSLLESACESFLRRLAEQPQGRINSRMD